MTTQPREGRCPQCNETVLVGPEGLCLWCETQTEPIEAPKPRRRAGRPKGKYQKIPLADLKKLHRLHYELGVPINELGRQIWQRYGFASAHTAGNSLSRNFREHGLPARDRIEMTVKASTKHGRARRDRRGNYKKERAYREWLAEQRGWRRLTREGEQQCEGIKTQPPNKGRRCERPALTGGRFCAQHDPERAAERAAHLARMRARQPDREMVPMATFQAWVQQRANELGSAKALARHLGVSKSAVSNWIRGLGTRSGVRVPIEEISLEVVDRALRADGSSAEELYSGAAHS